MNEYQRKIKELSQTPEFYSKVTKIGDKYDLMIDLQDELTAEIQNVIRGYKPSKEFLKNIMDRLEIDEDTARKITTDVNLEIFESLKNDIQKIQAQEETVQTPSTPAVSTPFKVVQVATAQVPRYTPATPPPNLPITPASALERAGQFTIQNPPIGVPQYNEKNLNKETVLKHIEDKEIPEEVAMIDHLLTTPVTTVEKVQIQKPLENKPYSSDPYREQI